MMKKTFALALALLMLLSLGACSSSSTSTSTVSTTVNGETTTTTTTTTTENGETTTTTTTETTEESDPTGLRAKWYEIFDGGAEGTNESGENFLFIYNNEASYGGLMIMDPGMTEQQVYILGPMVRDEEDADAYVIQDEVEDLKLRFWIENNGDDGFDVRFKDDDVAQLSYIDFDAVINDMVTLIESGVAH